MKKVIKSIFSVLAVGALLTSCSGDLEKRVSNLERRMVEMENKSQTTAAPAVMNQTAQNVSQPEQKPEGPLPEFSFAETEHDFGQIKEGEVVTHTFKFTNSGESPLIIQNATATCGCTVPDWTRKPIPVGESGEIVVKFDSSNKPGVQNKTVTITANTYPTISKLNIKSVVVADNATSSTQIN